MSSTNKILMPLDRAIDLALTTVKMKELGIPHGAVSIIGTPGGGKTQMIMSKCKDAGYGVLAFEPGLEPVEKMSGIPDISHENGVSRTVWSQPQMIWELNEASNKNKNVVAFLDDVHLMCTEQQKMFFELLTHSSLNGHKLNKNVTFVLAGNEKSAAGAKVQLSAIRNRCQIIYTKSDTKYWMDNYAIPQSLHPSGIAFLSMPINKPLFHEEENTDQFASPRSWTSMLNTLKYLESEKGFMKSPNKDSDLSTIFVGNVGEVVGRKFDAFYKIYQHIDTKTAFEKGIVNIPEGPQEKFAFATAVVDELFNRYVSSKEDKKYLKSFPKPIDVYNKIIEELNKENKELLIMSLKIMITRPQTDSCPSGQELFTELNISESLMEELLTTVSKISKGAL